MQSFDLVMGMGGCWTKGRVNRKPKSMFCNLTTFAFCLLLFAFCLFPNSFALYSAVDMSMWKHLAIVIAGGVGVLALVGTAGFLLWNGRQQAGARRGPETGVLITHCDVSASGAPDKDGFVLTLDILNATSKDVKLSRDSRIMARAADTGSVYVVTEAELVDDYLIPSRRPARLQVYLHMKCADESDWRKCFQSVYRNVEAFEIVDTVVSLPRPRL